MKTLLLFLALSLPCFAISNTNRINTGVLAVGSTNHTIILNATSGTITIDGEAIGGGGGFDGTNDTLSGSIFNSGTLNNSTISNITVRGTITIGGGNFAGITMGYNASSASRIITFTGPSGAPQLYADSNGLVIDGNKILTTADGFTNRAAVLTINGESYTVQNGSNYAWTVSGGGGVVQSATNQSWQVVALPHQWIPTRDTGPTSSNAIADVWHYAAVTNNPVIGFGFTSALTVQQSGWALLTVPMPSRAVGFASSTAAVVEVVSSSASSLTNDAAFTLIDPAGGEASVSNAISATAGTIKQFAILTNNLTFGIEGPTMTNGWRLRYDGRAGYSATTICLRAWLNINIATP